MYIPTPPLQVQQSVISAMDPRNLLGPLHLLSFSSLLGTQLYQTFLVTKICYTSLPRSAFTTLQKRLFPIYFRSQSLLLLLTIVTIPSRGPLTLVANKTAWIPFAIAGATATLNWWIYGPRTRELMIERVHQETRDGMQKKNMNDSGNADDDALSETLSPEMQRIRRSFSRNHAMSIHLNLLTIGAMLWWGYMLGSSLKLDLR
ncbi:hypothetical protein F5B22DRAFT_604745 [Xylaria bambusicola]|uniref:uncharacterized protein n=1 Tax=Xylaria bambusicola TaxID=326684 RepID=UPI0020078CC4|nr:uncharacterized protein F5B22DRAFT_604745 [Xylaria bambusicola]KAI0517097.1 hypothetical protein F5B22DRAFT_604745 [Xylaria bambusicola]